MPSAFLPIRHGDFYFSAASAMGAAFLEQSACCGAACSFTPPADGNDLHGIPPFQCEPMLQDIQPAGNCYKLSAHSAKSGLYAQTAVESAFCFIVLIDRNFGKINL
jgi:hypothetical protein